MKLRDPIVAYVAASNLELQVVVSLLSEAGIKALGVEETSPMTGAVTGYLPEIHRPKLWIERVDSERVGKILADYEARNALRRNRRESGLDVIVRCDACGEESEYDASLAGSVQNCPECGAFVDVGDASAEEDDWGEPEDAVLEVDEDDAE